MLRIRERRGAWIFDTMNKVARMDGGEMRGNRP